MSRSSVQDDEIDQGSISNVGSMSYADPRIMTHVGDDLNDVHHNPNEISGISGLSDMGNEFGFTWNKIRNDSTENKISDLNDAIIQLQDVVSHLIAYPPLEGGFRKTRMRKRFNRKTKTKTKSKKGKKGRK
jgi:hypothetical protein